IDRGGDQHGLSGEGNSDALDPDEKHHRPIAVMGDEMADVPVTKAQHWPASPAVLPPPPLAFTASKREASRCQIGTSKSGRMKMAGHSSIDRRAFMTAALYSGAALSALAVLPRAFAAEAINFADIGVGDPGGDWSRFTKASGGDTVNLVSIGNAPSAILNVLI